ncbi:elongation factor G [Streptomyces ochraceiscleroticus]|uniref:GTP-binding protein n=1 Tax=Streptomyces ochraceiscleroticus TaxID=47761 RepID=A0ABW1MN18_9ACTN|nr:TetM/TetW/TetO/TetS family tetracycline resistance ribosomal protection protein [Streptomyces ochraceiscleroticus]
MQYVNLGILAHVDAGKTSLTERLLQAAGVIDEVGSVDDGSTRTDSLELERQRGITIKSAVVSFVVDDELTVNLIDTPGHPDFIAEVERVLHVLDGAVLVVSAVEGVQPQTRILMRTLRRLGIPTLIFVNKIDRRGARCASVVRELGEKLDAAVVALGTVGGAAGTPGAAWVPYADADEDFAARLTEVLADHDDALLAAYVADETAVPYDRLRAGLAAQTQQALVHPVFFGSAITGAGVNALTTGIKELLPAAAGAAGGPLSGTVFKVERGPAGEKLAYVRMFSGAVRTRDRVALGGTEGKVTAVGVVERGVVVRRSGVVAAGEIGVLWGLEKVRIGDTVTGRGASPNGRGAAASRHFAPPTLETVVVPSHPSDKAALHVALSRLAEQDPLIGLRQDGVRQELSVSLYGEVQKEIVQATLAQDFGIEVAFRSTTVICIERLVGTGAAFEIMHKDGNPFLATVGLRVEPAPPGDGVDFRLAGELGSMPYAFIKAVEETVRETLRRGGPHGWRVPDCSVTLTHSGYAARQSHAHAVFDKSMSSTAGDFRDLTPLVLMRALRQAGTEVHEPVHRFLLDLPADALGPVLPVLARLGAVPDTPLLRNSACRLEGTIPAAGVRELQRALPSLTRGEGVLESTFSGYRPARAVSAR